MGLRRVWILMIIDGLLLKICREDDIGEWSIYNEDIVVRLCGWNCMIL